VQQNQQHLQPALMKPPPKPLRVDDPAEVARLLGLAHHAVSGDPLSSQLLSTPVPDQHSSGGAGGSSGSGSAALVVRGPSGLKLHKEAAKYVAALV
jgi:hypothetical protein